jgi:hypothetical protein
MFLDGFSIQSHSGGSFASTDPALVVHTMMNCIQDMFRHPTIMVQEERIAHLALEDAARADCLRFEADIRAIIPTVPMEPEPYQLTRSGLLDTGVAPVIVPHGHNTSPPVIPAGQYCPAPPGDTTSIASRLFPDVNMMPVLPALCFESPCLAPPNKFSHFSKFKTTLDSSVNLTDGTLLAMETFGDGSKVSLDVLMCIHYSFAPYAEWKLDYLLTTLICPPELAHHPCVSLIMTTVR